MNNIYENVGSNDHKLQMYNEMYPSQKDVSMSSYAGVMKDQDDAKFSVSNSDKLDLLRNLRFIKEE